MFRTPNIWWTSTVKQTAYDGREDIYPHVSHFLYPLFVSVIVTFLRLFIERRLFMPLGARHGLKATKPLLKKNDTLEKAFLTCNRNDHANPLWIQDLAKKVDWTEAEVKRWMRRRMDQDQPTELVYFTECGWRFTYHTTLFIIGLLVLWDKPWFWDINECWTNFPNQNISTEVWWYYIIHMSIYASLTYSQIVHWKRNDFVEMFIHHLVTLLLMVLSWASNTVRIGTLVLVVHDCADIFMEASRLAKFLKLNMISSLCGALFFISWKITRLGIFPFHILKNIWCDATVGILDSPVFFLLTLLLHVLLVLHIFWTYLILKVLYTFVTSGKIVDDSRSFAADLSSDEGELVTSSQKAS